MKAAFFRGVHSRNDGIFYRGARGLTAGGGSGLGALGKGLYLSWDKGMAQFFADRAGGQVYIYSLPADLNLLDAQSEEMAEIKKSMGFLPHQYSDDPMYAVVITNAAKDLGYEGVMSDKLADGLVLFDATRAKLLGTTKNPRRNSKGGKEAFLEKYRDWTLPHLMGDTRYRSWWINRDGELLRLQGDPKRLTNDAAFAANTAIWEGRPDEREGDIHIEIIRVNRDFQGHGLGRTILKKVLSFADKTGSTVSLVAESQNGLLSTAHLRDWYGRYGFKPSRFAPEFLIRHPANM